MRRSALRTAVLAVALLAALPARADFESGQQAWDAGRTDEALGQWQAAADSGDRRAMHALGRLYLQGLGVLQDYVEAHKWLNLAASRGEAAALAERDALAEKMTPAQVAEAQALARAWRPRASQVATAAEATPTPAAESAPETAGSAATPTSTSDAGPPPPRAIREAQALLAALGYRPGPADGVWGARSGAAYRAFLDDAGLPAADELTPETLRALRTAAKRRGVESDAAAARSRPSVRPDALHRAAKAGDVDGLKAALATGADVNARDAKGRTALMHAANKGYTLMVPLLLAAAGADVDVRAADGATALFMAVVHGHREVVEQLLAAGADISIKGPKSKTPMEIAKLRDDAKTVTLLEVAKRDDAAFERAKAAGTFTVYLRKPEGRHAREARRLKAARDREADDAAFAKAKSEDTGASYAEYLATHPKGRHADEAAFARAGWVDTGPAYAAYLELFPQGKHAADARSKSADAGPALNPKCSELPGKYHLGNHAECWEEIAGLPGCFWWNHHYYSDRPVYWSGPCSGGIADGDGTLSHPSGSGHSAVDATGKIANGKAHGRWVGRYAEGVWEGPYVDGKEHGHWVWRGADGDVYEGPYVDGRRHGRWVWRGADGSVYEGPNVDGRRHGRWVWRRADGRVGGGDYVDGKRDGEWVTYQDDGTIGRGRFVNGKRHGAWRYEWYSGGCSLLEFSAGTETGRRDC